MVHKVGGLTHHETEYLCKVFASLGDEADMLNQINSVPGLRHPTFHAVLRQTYFEMRGSADPGVRSQAAGIKARYEAFFSILYTQHQVSRLAAAGIQPDRASASKAIRLDVAHLAALVVSREDLVVAALARLLDIATPAEVSEAIGLPLVMGHDTIRLDPGAYSDTARHLFDPGAQFAAELAPLLTALYPKPYLTLQSHPNSIHAIIRVWDPTAAVSFITPVRIFLRIDRGDPFDALLQESADVLHPAIFPDRDRWVPIGVLASNLDMTTDALVQTLQIVAVGATTRLFVMPGFSARDPSTDRVIEVRSSQLLSVCEAWIADRQPELIDPRAERTVTTLNVAYSHAELQALVTELLREMAGDRADARRIGRVMLAEIGQKVIQGTLDLDVAVRQIQAAYRGVEADVPLYLPNDTGGDPRAEMISITLTEAMAQMRPTDFKLAAVLACQLANKCLVMGEDGRGRAALARAKKALDQLDSGPVTDHLWTVFFSSEAQLQRMSGDAAGAIASLDKAIALLRPVATNFESRGGDDVDVALHFAQYLKQLAGSQEQAGLPAEALGTYAESRHYLQRIIHYVERHADEFSGDSGRSYLLNQARYVLGGVLANEGTILKSSARVLDEIAAELPHLAFGELLSFAAGSHVGLDRQTRSLIKLFSSSLLEDIPRSASPGEAKVAALRLAYRRMQEALAISVALQGWNYGSIQSRSCAEIAEALSESPAVVAGYLEQAIGFARSAQNLAALGDMCADMAEVAERSGSLDAAAGYWIEAVKHSRAHAIAASTTSSADDRRRTYRGMVTRAFDLLVRLGRPFECVALAETAKSVFFSLDIQRGIPGARPTGNDDALSARLEALLAERERCASLLLENTEPRTPSERYRIAALDGEIASLRREIAATDPRVGSWTRWGDVHDLSAAELRSHLGESHSVAIGAFSAGDTIRLYVVSADDCVLCPTPVCKNDAEEVVTFFQQLAESHREAPLAQVLETLRDKFPALTWIEEQVARLMTPDTRYVIVAPDDALYGFPWAVLAPEGRPLAENAPIVIAVGLDSVLTSDSRGNDAVTTGQCLVLSDPLAGSRDGLPGAAEETRLIVESWGPSNVTVLAGARATVRALVEAAPKSQVVHLACHGRFGGMGENSGELRLAPSNDHLTQTGILTPAEIVRSLDLTKCSLVNLSACSVGRLREREGAGVDGVVSAFMIAGARNVIGSVSALEDTAAARFSGRFYEELVRGVSPAHALARTQLACFNGELGQPMRSPQYWAGYVVFCVAVR